VDGAWTHGSGEQQQQQQQSNGHTPMPPMVWEGAAALEQPLLGLVEGRHCQYKCGRSLCKKPAKGWVAAACGSGGAYADDVGVSGAMRVAHAGEAFLLMMIFVQVRGVPVNDVCIESLLSEGRLCQRRLISAAWVTSWLMCSSPIVPPPPHFRPAGPPAAR
jgi:hypothetical protein